MSAESQITTLGDAEAGYEPLLDQPSDAQAPNNNYGRNRGYSRRTKLLVTVPCLVLLMLGASALGFLYRMGAFSHISRDVQIVNGTVTEPNTKLVFPVNRAITIDGQRRVQRLVGLFLKGKYVPQVDMTIRVFVLATYVDRKDARRIMGKFKNGAPSANNDKNAFGELIDVMSSGKFSITTEYRMVMTPPGTNMQDRWLGDLETLWKSYQVTEDNFKKLKSCFTTWFKQRGFQNKDNLFLEMSAKSETTKAINNGVTLSPICADRLFAKAVVTHELLENGELAVNLLPTLWNTEYDDFEE